MSKVPVSRRTVLKASGAVATGMAVGAIPAHGVQAVRPDTGVLVYPFPLAAVSLLAGPFQANTACWVRIDTATNWARVFDFGSGTGVNMFLAARNGAGLPRFAITTTGAGGEQRIDGPTTLPVGAWTHLAVTQAGNLGVLYVNGAEVAGNSSLTLRPSALGATTVNRIGRSQYAGDPTLDAAVDSARIHARALTAAEVANLHTTGL
ncbi:LamG domain-containing protein [Micromonospora noduli]|uniref:LamG domain-containing protein n=1 Tax=Micromonospora noduli TaxID=709876 RepID=UPI00124B21A8|nr:LamG domain-containing protein [Micromonospora noduli]KAB1926884.1 LamG domain-containing protein [Micromonospora noduli]